MLPKEIKAFDFELNFESSLSGYNIQKDNVPIYDKKVFKQEIEPIHHDLSSPNRYFSIWLIKQMGNTIQLQRYLRSIKCPHFLS